MSGADGFYVQQLLTPRDVLVRCVFFQRFLFTVLLHHLAPLIIDLVELGLPGVAGLVLVKGGEEVHDDLLRMVVPRVSPSHV